VRGLPDARKEGNRWFCSQGHFLSYRGDFGDSRPRKRLRRTRAVLKWALLSFGAFSLLAVALALVPALGDENKSNPRGGKRATAPNSPSHAVALGKVGGAYRGWRLRITSVTPNAVSFLGDEQRNPPHAREFRVSVTATYRGPGHATLQDLFDRTYVKGSHNVAYSADSGDLNCARQMPDDPWSAVRPLNQGQARDVFSGATVRGHLCFAVAANDAKTLALFVEPKGCSLACTKRLWFALRKR
jgi:hypothetical protein